MPHRLTPHLVIDARPRGPRGPFARETVLGRSVLARLLDLAVELSGEPVVIHARPDEREFLEPLVAGKEPGRLIFSAEAPSEHATVLRTDRIYDPGRLRRALRRSASPETAVLWNLDGPHGLNGAEDELVRRRTYQPLGHYWALGPARRLARLLCPTRVRPNAVTIASASLMVGASALVAFASHGPAVHALTAGALAVALVLDTADGHLARLQGTASEFGRWLDGYLDELSDMVLHAAIAWSAYARSGHAGWLLAGMAYGMGKYVFVAGNSALPAADGPIADPGSGAQPQGRTLAAGQVLAVVDGAIAPTSRLGEPGEGRTSGSGEFAALPQGITPRSPVACGGKRNGPATQRLLAKKLAAERALKAAVRWAGHADVRWHLWIVLAAVGRLEWALTAYAVYFPVRSLAAAVRKGVARG